MTTTDRLPDRDREVDLCKQILAKFDEQKEGDRKMVAALDEAIAAVRATTAIIRQTIGGTA